MNISEINKKNYRIFEDMLSFVSAIARTITVMSWGARGWTNIEKKFLKFRVSAHRHKGYIYIGVNGTDLFDIWLTNLQGEIKKEFTDIYLEDLIQVIDEEIEKIPEYNY